MGFRDQFAQQQSLAAHIRFASKADIEARPRRVRFTPESGHRRAALGCPLCAMSGHCSSAVCGMLRPRTPESRWAMSKRRRSDCIRNDEALAVDAKKSHIRTSPTKDYDMASRQIKMPAKDDTEKEVAVVFSQDKRPERGRYLLQVDRQTKGSYTTLEAAQSAARAIKKGYPIVQVSVYDSVDYTHTLVEVPTASS